MLQQILLWHHRTNHLLNRLTSLKKDTKLKKHLLIEKDPTSSRRLVIPSDKVTEREALPPMDFKDILGHLSVLPAEERRLLALLMLTGMRRGEVLGLRWEDTSLDST